MSKFTIEQIDYLREKATISYEEAMETLERFDGDLGRCLVDLERRGRIKPLPRKAAPESNYRYEYRYDQPGGHAAPHHTHQDQPRGRAFVLDTDWLKQTVFSRVVVRKGDRVIANLSVGYLIFALCVAPHLMFVSVLLMFMMGYRVKWERKEEKKQYANDLYAFVDKTAENIRRTASSFAEAVKNEVRPQAPREDDRPAHGSMAQEEQVRQPAYTAPQAQETRLVEDNEEGEITIE